MIIPYGLEYTATTYGSVYKHVTCEHCAVEYSYEMYRFATGAGLSFLFLDGAGASERAQTKAENDLIRKLVRGVEVVPCPECGWVQSNMFRRARNQYGKWLST